MTYTHSNLGDMHTKETCAQRRRTHAGTYTRRTCAWMGHTQRDIHMEDIHMREHAHERERRGHVHGRTYTWRDIHVKRHIRRGIHMEDIHIKGQEGTCIVNYPEGHSHGRTYTWRDIHMKRHTRSDIHTGHTRGRPTHKCKCT